MNTENDSKAVSDKDLDELLSKDTGARAPAGAVGRLILWVAFAWSAFQVWIASPLPFIFRIGIFNDTEARSIHLAFAIFLAFLAFPALRSSPRDRIPIQDWVLAIAGAFCALYIFLFYQQISQRPGAPITIDIAVSVIGILLLLEATRRALGPPLMVVASVFLIYSYFGPYMPDIIAHRGVSLAGIANHQWITTEGVFGIALGVSTSFVFLFVLFGAMLDKAGAGNYFIKVAFSLLGHYRGGPAKAAVVASGLTGLISGSSIANTVTTGTFTIPMMKRVGFSAEKAGAVEVASSVNGQIMPPVMGAAAFLMVEYVGITYFQVITHAFLPAVISYIALIYIVHLEALKANMEGLESANPQRPLIRKVIGFLAGFILLCVTAIGVYYGMGWIKPTFGDAASYIVGTMLLVVYMALLWVASRNPELELDDPNSPVLTLPRTGPTVRSGLHFILPVVVLVWCLMVERLSPGLSAFWASVLMMFILVTQRPISAAMRGTGNLGREVIRGFSELVDGFIAGARNMIGIGIATAAAGIIVGSVSQTGVGLVLADLVEVLAFGNLFLILVLTAVLSLILGMGLPTTANYIVVSSLLAPVIVTLGQQNGLIVPLIAVHLFVFYFGIMADVTPPVGLASFAAAAVSKGDPIRTGLQAFYYSLRTAALPFLFIFNTDLLLINVDFAHGLVIFVVATIAMLIFAAGTQGYFMTRSRWYESILLLLVAFTFFRPGFWMDMIYPPYDEIPATGIFEAADRMEEGDQFRLWIDGVDSIGNPRTYVVYLPLGEGDTGEDRLLASGLELFQDGDRMVIDNVSFGSPAAALGLEFDEVIAVAMVPADNPPKELFWLPAALVLAAIVALQRGRARRHGEGAVATATT